MIRPPLDWRILYRPGLGRLRHRTVQTQRDALDALRDATARASAESICHRYAIRLRCRRETSAHLLTLDICACFTFRNLLRNAVSL